MPTKKKKNFHLVWKETIQYSALVQTEWTPDEIVAHNISSESEVGPPVWQELLEDQVLDSKEHVISRGLELLEIIEARPIDTKAEDLPLDHKIELIDRIRELAGKKWGEGEFHAAVVKAFSDHGMDPVDPGEWGVLDTYGKWTVYKVSEEQAKNYWVTHEGTWRLCSSIIEDKGGDHYVVMDERESNAPSRQ